MSLKPNGEFELQALASTNRTCTIEYSTDLVNWTFLTDFTGQGETPVTATDSEVPGQSRRFYRMK